MIVEVEISTGGLESRVGTFPSRWNKEVKGCMLETRRVQANSERGSVQLQSWQDDKKREGVLKK